MSESPCRGRASIDAARDVLRARAEAKRKLRDRRLTWAASRSMAAELVQDPPDELRGMRLRELLLATRGIGPKNLDSYAQAAHLTNDASQCARMVDKPLAELTKDERTRLLAVLRLDLSAGRRD